LVGAFASLICDYCSLVVTSH